MTINITELRRLAQAATPGPDGISLSWITLLQDFQQGVSPAVINELLDRLEAAESDALEQARLNGMGSEREAALMAKLEMAENERTIDEQRVADLMAELNRVGQENEELRARIDEMEQQAPSAPDGVAEALQRLIENGAVLGPASAEDALLVARYRQRLLACAPSAPECPYPCGWRNLLKLAIEDGAYLARSINEDEPVTENARAVTMRTVMRLRDVLMAINNAAPEAKP